MLMNRFLLIAALLVLGVSSCSTPTQESHLATETQPAGPDAICPGVTGTDNYQVDIPEASLPSSELEDSLVPRERIPTGVALCRYVRSRGSEASLEDVRSLANPADLAGLAEAPAVSMRTTSCTQPPEDAHYYLIRLDYGDGEVSWVSVGASDTGGYCTLARNGHFVADITLGSKADAAWADGSWPRS